MNGLNRRLGKEFYQRELKKKVALITILTKGLKSIKPNSVENCEMLKNAYECLYENITDIITTKRLIEEFEVEKWN